MFGKSEIAHFWYNVMLGLAICVGLPYWVLGMLRPKRRATLLQRLGLARQGTAAAIQDLPRIRQRRPIWIHGLSVGEIQSAEPLIKALAETGAAPLVLSVSTRSGYATAHRLYASEVQGIFYFPYDISFAVRHALTLLQPRLVIILETDLWPNFLFELQRRRIPAALINARISHRSLVGYERIQPFIRQCLAAFSTICAQSELDADRFRKIGLASDRIHITGNIKFDQPTPDRHAFTEQDLRRRLGLKPQTLIVVAGSTHRGEDHIILDVFSRLRHRIQDMVLIIAPRYLERSRAIAAMAENHGLSHAWVTDLTPTAQSGRAAVLIVNAMGLLRTLYTLADIAFVGGSLVPIGGHNPLEPAALAKPILFGPHMGNCRAVALHLTTGGGARCVHDQEELTAAMEYLLTNESERRQLGRRAREVFLSHQGAVQKTMDALAPYL